MARRSSRRNAWGCFPDAARRGAAVLLALAAISVTQGSAAPSQDVFSEPLQLDTAEWVVTSPDQTPLLTSGWRPVQLPDADATRRHEGSRLGDRPHGPLDAPLHWYRFRFEVSEFPDRSLALYAPRVSDRARIYVNGSMIDRSFLQRDRVEHGWNRPLWSVIPPIALQPGDNEVLIGLDSPFTGSITMSRLQVGTPGALRDRYDASFFLRVGTPQAGAWMLGGLALFSLGVWGVRPAETLHLLLGLGAAVFSFRLLHYFVTVPLFSPAVFWWLTTIALPWAMVFLFLFAFQYYGMQRRWLTRLLVAVAIVTSLLVMPGIGFSAYEAAPWIFLGLIPLSGFTAALLLQRAWRVREAPPVLLAVGYLATVAGGTHDLLVMLHLISIERPYVMPIGAVLMFLSFALALGARYVQSLREFEAMNETLEARVQERQQALEESFQRLEHMGREQVLADERQRLMREIHDGIGANLVATLAAVESAEARDAPAAQALRQAIADLKLTVDSLEPVEGDLLSLLGNLRYRLTPQLREAGIAVEWEVAETPPLEWLRAPQALHVLRIVQEALSNVIQHAGADTVRLGTRVRADEQQRPEQVEIWVRDNGSGFEAGASGRSGRGVDNMRYRAEALGGGLRVRSRHGDGTEVCIELPVRSPAMS